MLNRNTSVPWLYAAGGVALGLVSFKAVSALTRRGRARVADTAVESGSGAAALRHSGEIAVADDSRAFEQQARPAVLPREDRGALMFSAELYEDELEAALSGAASVRGDAYDAVAPDDLASEWLSRATEFAVVTAPEESLDPEVAEILRAAGMSMVSEGSLNYASPDQLEAAVGLELEGTDELTEDGALEYFEVEFDDRRSSVR